MADLRVSFPKPCDEPWEAMTPTGCDRVCVRCDKVIHDLAERTFDEAEALLRDNPDSCVRARIEPNGSVALKEDRKIVVRRMVVAAAVSVSLLATSTPTIAREKVRRGGIVGNLGQADAGTKITATGNDGKSYRTRVNFNGQYKFVHLPPGVYKLTVTSNCGGDDWVVENVVVVSGKVLRQNTDDWGRCIVVGQLRLENNSG